MFRDSGFDGQYGVEGASRDSTLNVSEPDGFEQPAVLLSVRFAFSTPRMVQGLQLRRRRAGLVSRSSFSEIRATTRGQTPIDFGQEFMDLSSLNREEFGRWQQVCLRQLVVEEISSHHSTLRSG